MKVPFSSFDLLLLAVKTCRELRAQCHMELTVHFGHFKELNSIKCEWNEDIGVRKYHQAALRRRQNNPNREFTITKYTHIVYLTVSLSEEINPLSEPSSVRGAVFRIVLS